MPIEMVEIPIRLFLGTRFSQAGDDETYAKLKTQFQEAQRKAQDRLDSLIAQGYKPITDPLVTEQNVQSVAMERFTAVDKATYLCYVLYKPIEG